MPYLPICAHCTQDDQMRSCKLQLLQLLYLLMYYLTTVDANFTRYFVFPVSYTLFILPIISNGSAARSASTLSTSASLRPSSGLTNLYWPTMLTIRLPKRLRLRHHWTRDWQLCPHLDLRYACGSLNDRRSRRSRSRARRPGHRIYSLRTRHPSTFFRTSSRLRNSCLRHRRILSRTSLEIWMTLSRKGACSRAWAMISASAS